MGSQGEVVVVHVEDLCYVYDAEGKKGKLSDVEEHVNKAKVLRERLTLSVNEKKAWVLEGESELASILHSAESWLEKVCWMP